jgi:hypothetical protein
LFASAFQAPLNPPQQQQLFNDIKSDATIMAQCGLAPQRLPELVENNPVVAIECLVQLLGTPQVKITWLPLWAK